MGTTPVIIAELIAWAGNLAANYFIVQGFDGRVADIVCALVVNLLTLGFVYLIRGLLKTGLKMEIISGVIAAVEEQAGPYDSGADKLEAAVELLDKELAARNVPFFTKLLIRPMAKLIISAVAKPLKGLLYANPPVKTLP